MFKLLASFFMINKLSIAIITAVLLASVGVYLKYNSMMSTIKTQQQSIKDEQDRVEQLRGELNTMIGVNKENALVIKAQKADIDLKLNTIAQLNKTLTAKGESYTKANQRLSEIKDVPVPLTNYWRTAIEDIQSIDQEEEQK